MIGINRNNLKIELIAHNIETHIFLTVLVHSESVSPLDLKAENLQETFFRPGPPDLECLVNSDMPGHYQVDAIEF